MINKEPSHRVAKSLGFERSSVRGVVRILKSCGYCPSKERLALVAMVVPDVTDEDVAGWFGESLAWATNVRADADHWRSVEFFPAQLEFIDDGYCGSDPTPAEIEAKKSEIRSRNDRSAPNARVGVRSFQWSGKRGSFLSIGVD